MVKTNELNLVATITIGSVLLLSLGRLSPVCGWMAAALAAPGYWRVNHYRKDTIGTPIQWIDLNNIRVIGYNRLSWYEHRQSRRTSVLSGMAGIILGVVASVALKWLGIDFLG